MTRALELLEAGADRADSVVRNWVTRDLAQAVRELEEWTESAHDFLSDDRAAPDTGDAIAGAIARTRMALDIGRKAAARKQGNAEALRLLASDLAATLGAADSAFDKAAFMAACGFAGEAA